MMYYMTSKDFENIFLENEDDDDILDTQYVIVSSRIRSGGRYKNILSAYNILFPTNNVIIEANLKKFKTAYIDYIEKNRLAFLASLVLACIEKKVNIVFICSKKESKLMFLEALAFVIYKNFDYPMYNYKEYVNGDISLIPYDSDKVAKKCKKILKKTSDLSNINKLQKFNEKDKEGAIKYFKKNPKRLKKILKKKGLYTKSMNKYEMLDVLESMYV